MRIRKINMAKMAANTSLNFPAIGNSSPHIGFWPEA
jgi:hypothetical protein